MPWEFKINSPQKKLQCACRGWMKGVTLGVEARIKRLADRRRTHYRALLDSMWGTNDTDFSDKTVLAILAAKHGSWSKAMTLDDMLRSLGIDP